MLTRGNSDIFRELLTKGRTYNRLGFASHTPRCVTSQDVYRKWTDKNVRVGHAERAEMPVYADALITDALVIGQTFSFLIDKMALSSLTSYHFTVS